MAINIPKRGRFGMFKWGNKSSCYGVDFSRNKRSINNKPRGVFFNKGIKEKICDSLII